MKQAIIFGIIAIAVIAGGIYYTHHIQTQTSNNQTADQNQNTNPPTTMYKSEAELTAAAAATPITDSTLADGLKITDVVTGSGAPAQSGDTVTVNYIGTYANGKKFDASFDHGVNGFPFTLGAGNVIKGWDEGVAGMQVGGIRKLVIPPTLGYGPNDYSGIPDNSTLYFTIQLLKIGS